MKNDFLIAITQLAAEKQLPREVVLDAVELALASAFKKDNFAPEQDVIVRIHPQTGETQVFLRKTVVETVEDPLTQISLSDARKIDTMAHPGGTVDIREPTPPNAGRIAAQTAKQVVLQRLREAEREVVFEEYVDKEGDIVSGVVQKIDERGDVTLDLGKAEAVLPPGERPPNEHYRVGQRLKAYLLEVRRTGKGPVVIVSRTHRNLLKRLFELEVPEIYNGLVEIKSIAREPGARSKVAVAARQTGIDPVGACVGMRGIRIQNIVAELNGEKIDVVQWSADTATFVANALSPAPVVAVDVRQEENTARVIVPDRQLSLAIGKDGQNARLAAKLTGLRIDIKAQSAVEPEERVVREAEQAAARAAQLPVEAAPFDEPIGPPVTPARPLTAVGVEPQLAAAQATPVEEEVEESLEELLAPLLQPSRSTTTPVTAGSGPAKPIIRFAEDIAEGGPRGARKGREQELDITKPKPKVKAAKRAQRLAMEADDYDEYRY